MTTFISIPARFLQAGLALLYLSSCAADGLSHQDLPSTTPAPLSVSTQTTPMPAAVPIEAAGLCDHSLEPGHSPFEGCYNVDALRDCAPQEVPRGLYLLVGWAHDAVVDLEAFSQPIISGATVRVYWKDLEPAPGVYDWSKLDLHFDLAAARGKQIRLAIAGGAYAPSWLLEDEIGVEQDDLSLPGICDGLPGTLPPSPMGVERFCAKVPNGVWKDSVRPFPAPWDGVVRNRWAQFLNALIVHLEGQDVAGGINRLPVLSWIAVTGPNGHNGEVSHPHQGVGKEELDWYALGLSHPTVPGETVDTKAELLEALIWTWGDTLELFDGLFGSQRIHYTVSFIFRSFPDGKGNEDADLAFKEALLAHGNSLENHEYFGVQTNGLDDNALWSDDEAWPRAKDHWRYVRQHPAGRHTLTGFQSRAPNRLYEMNGQEGLQDEEDNACARGRVWRTMVHNARCVQVDFVEVYASDLAFDLDASCNGGIRYQLEQLHQWLTD